VGDWVSLREGQEPHDRALFELKPKAKTPRGPPQGLEREPRESPRLT
jgi:hypothetical protein